MANRVKASLGVTLNIGNFQSARVDCGVEADVLPNEDTQQAMDRVFGFVQQFVDEKIVEMRKDIESDE